MISVIIPCYNTLHFLEKNLQSVIDFVTFCSGEIIIVDDGSEQNIQEFIDNKKNDKMVYFKQRNEGVASARNKGILLAKYDTLLFLDSDDSLNFSILEDNFNKLISSDFCYWGAKKIFPDGKEKLYLTKRKESSNELLISLFKREQQIFIGGFTVSKKIASSLLFDIRYKYGEDLKFISESILQSENILMIDSPLLNYIQHADSAISNFSNYRFDSLYAISSIKLEPSNQELNSAREYLLKRDRIVILRTLSKSKSLRFIIQYYYTNSDMRNVVKQHFGWGYLGFVNLLAYVVLYKSYRWMHNKLKY
ncbi:glycosyltransferase family 2 protein [Escherichia coli]|nr:glycosyltransferase family 2 protein [Escherichia coli]EME1182195.1 glycosyltransferase family 2 protein [Escherichia coli]